MITINRKEFPFEEGLHLQELLDRLKATGDYSYIINKTSIVRINNVYIPSDAYDTTYLQDGDHILILPQLVGG